MIDGFQPNFTQMTAGLANINLNLTWPLTSWQTSKTWFNCQKYLFSRKLSWFQPNFFLRIVGSWVIWGLQQKRSRSFRGSFPVWKPKYSKNHCLYKLHSSDVISIHALLPLGVFRRLLWSLWRKLCTEFVWSSIYLEFSGNINQWHIDLQSHLEWNSNSIW